MENIMGHSHSHASSHKRLRSISSSKNCAEFTEVVDLEFSDASTFSEPVFKLESKNFGKNSTSKAVIAKSDNQLDTVPEETAKSPQVKIQYPKDLLLLEDHVKEVAQSIEKMSNDEFFIYFPTLKDDLHNCWQKVYAVKEQNLETKLKKYKIIDNIRALLRKLNARLQRKEFGKESI